MKVRKTPVFASIVYLLLTFLCFHLLWISRSGEARTVWEVLHPMFAPAFFATTVLLVVFVFLSERIELKLVFIIFYAILVRSFSAIVFPAGIVGFQQAVLAITRRIYDNTVLHGWGGTAPYMVRRVSSSFDGKNFQSVYTIMFARMFGVDVSWTHLFLAPVLWGVFAPITAFLVAKTLFSKERIWVLSGLLTSAFPLLVSWGTISVPNSLGYIFFFSCLYFSLKYISCQERVIPFLLVTLVVASFMAHPLSGIMSLAFATLAFAFKSYREEKFASSLSAKFTLLFSLLFSISLLPFALVSLRFFSPTYVYFSLDKIADMSMEEKIGLFVLGEYWNYDPLFRIIHMAGPVLGFIGVLYVLWKSRKERIAYNQQLVLFSCLGLIVVLVDYRILKLFMVGLPFEEERIWVFRDFTLLPFVALIIYGVISSIKASLKAASPPTLSIASLKGTRESLKAVLKGVVLRCLGLLFTLNVLFPLFLSGWMTASVYFGPVYPYHSSLQIAWYEIEAARFIDETSNVSYVVIGDQYFMLTGGMFVGVSNPTAYYFPFDSPDGSKLFHDMKMETTRDVMLEAMEINNATIAYFVIQKARLPNAEYYGIVDRAEVNGVQTRKVIDSNGVEKLRIFYCGKT